MSSARPFAVRLPGPDGLAAGPASMIRSAAMTADPEAKLARVKHRLYVLCQTAG
jgi:hypothetical protein